MVRDGRCAVPPVSFGYMRGGRELGPRWAESMVNNLNLPRPDAWTQGSLFAFIEDCWSNAVAAVANKNIIAYRLTEIDAIFEEAHRHLKPSDVSQIIPAFLSLRSFGAFRASVMVCLSLPTDSFPLQRSCLENAGYARLISTVPELSERWLNRDEDPEAKSRFSNRAVRESIASADGKLAAIYQELYERTIDFGAHPNEKSVLMSVVKEFIKTETVRFMLLQGDGLTLDHALRSCAQVAICALKVLHLIFSNQFEALGIEAKIARAASAF